jgi:dTDP-4-dehydrorhamnose reductase
VRILLLGASGLLGGVLHQHLSRSNQVLGTSTRSIPGLMSLDLNRPAELDRLLREPVDLVVHAAGVVDLAAAERDPARAERVHVTATEQLVSGTAAKIVFVSTDNVFPGTADRYVETDDPGPRSVYGRTKLAAEQLVLAAGGNVVIRLPFLFGYSPHSSKFVDRFARPRTPAVADVVTNPVYLPDVAAALPRLWEMTGIVHFGGATTVSRFEFMDAARRSLGLATEVVAIRNSVIDPAGLRPGRLVLASARHSLCGRPLAEALADMAAAGAEGG